MKFLLPILLAAAFVSAACSGDGDAKTTVNSDSNSNANSVQNNVPFNQEICADDLEFCETANCRLCRYDREVVAEEGSWPVMAAGPEPVIAYFDESKDELVVTRRTAPGTWEAETAWVAPNGWTERSIHMAIAADGEPWITIADDNRAVTLVFHDDTGWNAEAIPDIYDASPIAIANDGTPWIIHGALEGGVALTGRVDGSWQTTTLETGDFTNTKDIHALESGIAVAWVNRTASELRFAIVEDGAFETEVLLEGNSDNVYPLSLSIASDGDQIAVAVGDRVAVRQNGTWTETRNDSRGQNNVLVAEDGHFTLISYEFFGLAVGQRVDTSWPSQLISTECDDDALGAALGPNGELFINYWCGGEIELMERTGLYREGYEESCRSLTRALCDTALECNPDASSVSGDLCLFNPSGSVNCINVPSCYADFHGAVCGDASQDPSLVDDCAASTPSECRNDGDDGGVVLPEVCAFR